MEIKIVLGLNFGDEGKGMVVQNLCKQALAENKRVLVVRFSGGPQAAHTVINNGVSHICSTYGSGCLLNVPTLWIGYETAIDPITFFNEKKVLNQKGFDPEIMFAHVINTITPYDVLFNQSDEKSLKDGTCGKGVFAAHSRRRLPLYHCANSSHLNDALSCIKTHYGNITLSHSLQYKFIRACEKIQHYVTYDANNIITQYDVVILEGSQGLLLDPHHSMFKPHVTATHLLNFPVIDSNTEFYLVSRSYLTRHGNGYEPIKCDDFYDLSDKYETNVLNEFQGEFKTGVLSLDLINRILDRIDLMAYNHNKFNLVITHMDIPFEQNKFMFELGRSVQSFKDLNIEVTPYNICNFIKNKLYLEFDNVYYTNSPTSSIHLCQTF